MYLGVHYEDLLNSSKPEIAEALALADPEVIHGRMRRLKRASDLCLKQKRLIDYVPEETLEPFKFELMNDINNIKKRDEEFERLNLHKK
jgi:hypothetical protein